MKNGDKVSASRLLESRGEVVVGGGDDDDVDVDDVDVDDDDDDCGCWMRF
jgi:hypothetical protein